MEFKNEVYMKKNVNLVGGGLLILLSSCSKFSEINNVDNEIENYESTPKKEADKKYYYIKCDDFSFWNYNRL